LGTADFHPQLRQFGDGMDPKLGGDGLAMEFDRANDWCRGFEQNVSDGVTDPQYAEYRYCALPR